jgi:hypothetical protein
MSDRCSNRDVKAHEDGMKLFIIQGSEVDNRKVRREYS